MLSQGLVENHKRNDDVARPPIPAPNKKRSPTLYQRLVESYKVPWIQQVFSNSVLRY
jgi:hypothetical protein